MKKITMGMFSLAALVAMATISAKTVRAEAGVSLEAAKQESGIEFGEMGGQGRGGSSTVSASGDGVSRPALTVGKLNMKAMQARPEVPSRASAYVGPDQYDRGRPALDGSLSSVLGGLGVVAGVAVGVGAVGLGILGLAAGIASGVGAVIVLGCLGVWLGGLIK